MTMHACMSRVHEPSGAVEMSIIVHRRRKQEMHAVSFRLFFTLVDCATVHSVQAQVNCAHTHMNLDFADIQTYNPAPVLRQ